MSFWKLIGSDKRVEQALAKSVGYNVSPSENEIHQGPLNWDDIVSGRTNHVDDIPEQLTVWSDYVQKVSANDDSLTEEKIWATVRKR